MSDNVRAETEIEFERWRPPNFAIIAQDPTLAMRSDGQAVKIENLSAQALNAMAEAWLDDLYLKASAPNPFTRTR